MATRIVIRGITVVLPRDAKLSKKDLAAKYGKGSSFNHTTGFTDQLHAKIEKANKQRIADQKGEDAKEVSKQDSEKPTKDK
jgi:hypothetical protein